MLVTGAPGGSRIITTVLQVIVDSDRLPQDRSPTRSRRRACIINGCPTRWWSSGRAGRPSRAWKRARHIPCGLGRRSGRRIRLGRRRRPRRRRRRALARRARGRVPSRAKLSGRPTAGLDQASKLAARDLTARAAPGRCGSGRSRASPAEQAGDPLPSSMRSRRRCLLDPLQPSRDIWSHRNNLRCRAAERNGAGEGIRTLDPNLGKVVLYP